jgi:phage recombination protein Bet
MSNELVKQNANIMQTTKFTPDQIDLIKSIYCKGLENDEIKLFIAISEKSGLDPFNRQIYAIKRWNSKLKKEMMTIQTGIDGFRLIADRTGLYMGTSDTEFEFDKNDNLIKASITVHKWNEKAQQKCDFTATAFLVEYKPDPSYEGKENPMWRKMPRVMLEKCAEAKALRKAFPQELSGLYEQSELDQSIDNEVEKSIINNVSDEYKKHHKEAIDLCKEMSKKYGFTEDEIKKEIKSLGKDKVADYDIHGLLALKDALSNAIKSKLDNKNNKETITIMPIDNDDSEDDLK